MCVAFVIPVLCLLYIVLCSSLSCHFHVFFSKCCHARNLSFSVECASNHSSFNMFWLSFCVFSHVGSSCLLLHSGILWQQVILFHIGKTPCECINLYTRLFKNCAEMKKWYFKILWDWFQFGMCWLVLKLQMFSF